jgi:hypothetical protein
MTRLAFSAFVAFSICAAHAGAQDAAALVEEGLALRREGRDAEAAERFRAAYAIDRAPRSLAQLALAEQGAGEWVAAERDLLAAMERADDPWIASHAGVLESALATIRSHLGRLSVVSNVEGAELFVDGRSAGTLPLAAPISAAVGTVVVEVRAVNHVPVQRSASIRAGELSRLSIDLVALSAPGEGTPSERETIAPEERAGPSLLLTVGLVTAGVAVAALIATLVAVGVREENVSHWNDDARCPPDAPGGRLENCAGVYAALRTAEDWSIAGGIATGILGAGAAVLIGIGATESSSPRASIRVSPRAIGIELSGTF